MNTKVPTVELQDGFLKIQFPYHPDSVRAIKQIIGARWDPNLKSWFIHRTNSNLRTIKLLFPNLQFGSNLQASSYKDQENIIQSEEKKYLQQNKEVKITDFKFATEPFWHQKITFNFARSIPQSAIFLEQGLGKAKIAIDLATWRFRKNQIHRVFVVCPNSVAGQWVEEILRHGHDDFKQFLVLNGPTKKRIQAIQRVLEEGPSGWIITNYESLLNLYDTIIKIQNSKTKLFDMIVLDESSKIKHASSKRSKLSWKIGTTVTYKNILTGTPVTQSAEDIFAQYRFLKPDIFGIYATAFRASYLIMGGFENRQIVGYRNISGFLKNVYTVAIRFTKDRCLDLPEKTYEKRVARLSPEISQKYYELEKECIAEFDGAKVAAPLVMTKLMKLSQITGGFIYEQGPDGKKIKTHVFKTNAKLDVLEEILEETGSKKIIIWCRFTQELNSIKQLLLRRGIKFVSISGEILQEERQKAVSTFQTDADYQVFLGQVATAGFGITLTAANLVIYYSNTYSLEDRLQSEDRCHRIGQKNPVTYIDILAETASGKKTIDFDIMEIIRGKASFANEISLALIQKMVARKQQEPIRVSILKEDFIDEGESFDA